MTLEELKASALKKDKGNTITESDYTFRKKTEADLGINTIIMTDTSKYAEDIAKAKAELGIDERAKMKAELMAELREELKASKGVK